MQSPARTHPGQRVAEAVRVAPYLTHVVRHHGQLTLVPPDNAGRVRKAKTREIEQSSPVRKACKVKSRTAFQYWSDTLIPDYPPPSFAEATSTTAATCPPAPRSDIAPPSTIGPSASPSNSNSSVTASSPSLVSPSPIESQSSESSLDRLQPDPIMIPPIPPSRSQLHIPIPEPHSSAASALRYSTQANDSGSDSDSGEERTGGDTNRLHIVTQEEGTPRATEWEKDRMNGLSLEVRTEREHRRELERLGATSAVSMRAMGRSRSQLTLVPGKSELQPHSEIENKATTPGSTASAEPVSSIRPSHSRLTLGPGRRDRQPQPYFEEDVPTPCVGPSKSQLTLTPDKPQQSRPEEGVDEFSGSSPSTDSQDGDSRGRSPTPQSPTRANRKRFYLFSSGEPSSRERQGSASPSSPTFSSSQLSLPLQFLVRPASPGHKPKSRSEGFIPRKLFGLKGKEKEKGKKGTESPEPSEALDSWEMLNDSSAEETTKAASSCPAPIAPAVNGSGPSTRPYVSPSATPQPSIASDFLTRPKRHSMLDRPIPPPPVAPFAFSARRPAPPPPSPLRSSLSGATHVDPEPTGEPRSEPLPSQVPPSQTAPHSQPLKWVPSQNSAETHSTNAAGGDEHRADSGRSPVVPPEPSSVHPFLIQRLSPPDILNQGRHPDAVHRFFPYAPSPPPSSTPGGSPISVKSSVTYVDYGPGTFSSSTSQNSPTDRPPRRSVPVRSPLHVTEAYASSSEGNQESIGSAFDIEPAAHRRERSRSTSPTRSNPIHTPHGPRTPDKRHDTPNPIFLSPSLSSSSPIEAQAPPEIAPENRVVSVIGDIIDLYDHTPAPTNPDISVAELHAHSDQSERQDGDGNARWHYPGRPLPLPPGAPPAAIRPISVESFMAGMTGPRAHQGENRQQGVHHSVTPQSSVPIQVAYTSSLQASPPTHEDQVPHTPSADSHMSSGSSNPLTESDTFEDPSPAPSPAVGTSDNSNPYHEYTDLDVLLSRLEDGSNRTGDNYENLLLVADIMGSGGPARAVRTPPSPAIGRVELQRRRVTKDGRVKLKLSLLGVTIDRCSICMSQFKEGELAGLGTGCQHASVFFVFHEKCLSSWLARNRTCPLCRAAFG
ncbi:hypothetical protein EW146_g8238 [Bondarzewia mesenterica]|uniref:RING-type domain-containing protein n=1 Tax=Bondarzewia mesenterica TaxID=1095465 RepID=A0A4S4LLI2_9AGAM|nr:hypothetical protein EW146_g8238 [Bondarzewia mesenterica]